MRKIVTAAAAIGLLAASGAAAQVRITHDGWEGFSTHGADGKLENCVLYNRSIDAINVEPYAMLGLSRDGAGHVGLLIFYQPHTLTRGPHVPVALKIDQHPPVMLMGDVISDFHVKVAGPLDQATLTALRHAKSIDVTTQEHTQAFAVHEVGGVLDALASSCTNTPH